MATVHLSGNRNRDLNIRGGATEDQEKGQGVLERFIFIRIVGVEDRPMAPGWEGG